jgi:hypothetical protein
MQRDNRKKKAWAQLIDKRMESVKVGEKKRRKGRRHVRACSVGVRWLCWVVCMCHMCVGNPDESVRLVAVRWRGERGRVVSGGKACNA